MRFWFGGIPLLFSQNLFPYFTTLKISMTLAPWHTILEHIAISYCTEFLDVTDETVCMLNNVQTGTIILNYLKMGIFKKQKGTIF